MLLISVTYGNIDVHNCLRNVVSLFHHIEKEIAWRKARGHDVGFETLLKNKPVVAVGPDHPLMDEMLMADYFHGNDGLGGISDSVSTVSTSTHYIAVIDNSQHPHMSPADTWKGLFSSTSDPEHEALQREAQSPTLFRPSRVEGHKEILNLLKDNEPDTITIVAIGPLTNLAIAAAEDPETFLRVKEVVSMGGNIYEPGNVKPSPIAANAAAAIHEPPFRLIKQPPGPFRDALTSRNQITPVAEFNVFADSVAAARVYTLSSPNPHTTMPPTPPAPPGVQPGQAPPPFLQPYPKKLSRKLKATLFPLDITNKHVLTRGEYRKAMEPLLAAGSPLAEWTNAWLSSTFTKMEALQDDVTGDAVGLQLHDPLCIWYCITQDDPKWKLAKDEDIRIETSGQWTRGMCVIDQRSRLKMGDELGDEVAGDHGKWLNGAAGNRLGRCIQSPGQDVFGTYILKKVFGV